MKYAYIRVSSKDQNLNRQFDAIKEYEVPKRNIFIDKCSGKDFSRDAYQRMIRRLRRGDILVIKSIDRLGRNYQGIQEEWRRLASIGVDMIVIDMPILNTAGQNDLMKQFVSDMVLQILSFVAELERENTRQRQREGIAAAKARGVKFGRPAKKRNRAFYVLKEKWARGEISARAAANMLGIATTTFLIWAREGSMA